MNDAPRKTSRKTPSKRAGKSPGKSAGKSPSKRVGKTPSDAAGKSLRSSPSKAPKPSREAPPKRQYDNSLREEHAKLTRERILEAFAEQLMGERTGDVSISDVATRSGVSPATIYRYFPNRDALYDAIDEWLGRSIGRPELAETLEVLSSGAPTLFRFFEANIDKHRLARSTAAVGKVIAHAQRTRDRAFRRMLSSTTAHLEARRAAGVHALIRALFSFDTFAMMKERFGVDAEVASDTVGWATRVLVRELEREGSKEAGTRRRKKGPA